MDICSFLDPRVKSTHYLTQVEKAQLQDRVFQLMADMDRESHDTDDDVLEVVGETNPCPLDELIGAQYSSPSAADSDVDNDKMLELRAYMKEPIVNMNVCPMTWWRNNQHKYRVLAKLARKYLAIQGTSVASERVFSLAGHIINTKRTSLNETMVNMILCLNKNAELWC